MWWEKDIYYLKVIVFIKYLRININKYQRLIMFNINEQKMIDKNW